MSIIVKETTVWHTFQNGSFGFGIVGKKSASTDPQNYDGDILFSHKLSEKTELTDEDREEIDKDCKDLIRLLKKFYFEDDYVEE